MKIKKEIKVCCYVITVHVRERVFFSSMDYDKLPHEQLLHFFHALQAHACHNSMIHAKSSKEQVFLLHVYA